MSPYSVDHIYFPVFVRCASKYEFKYGDKLIASTDKVHKFNELTLHSNRQ